MKKEIFLAKLSINAKKESIADLKQYMVQREKELENQNKLTQEATVLFDGFLQEEARKVQALKEKHFKLDEERVVLGEQINQTRTGLVEVEIDLKRLNEEISVERD